MELRKGKKINVLRYQQQPTTTNLKGDNLRRLLDKNHRLERIQLFYGEEDVQQDQDLASEESTTTAVDDISGTDYETDTVHIASENSDSNTPDSGDTDGDTSYDKDTVTNEDKDFSKLESDGDDTDYDIETVASDDEDWNIFYMFFSILINGVKNYYS